MCVFSFWIQDSKSNDDCFGNTIETTIGSKVQQIEPAADYDDFSEDYYYDNTRGSCIEEAELSSICKTLGCNYLKPTNDQPKFPVHGMIFHSER